MGNWEIFFVRRRDLLLSSWFHPAYWRLYAGLTN
jgi:hypothetical protein